MNRQVAQRTRSREADQAGQWHLPPPVAAAPPLVASATPGAAAPGYGHDFSQMAVFPEERPPAAAESVSSGMAGATTEVLRFRQPLSATIRRAAPPAEDRATGAAAGRATTKGVPSRRQGRFGEADAVPGEEEAPTDAAAEAAVQSALPAPAGIQEPEEGQSVAIPNVVASLDALEETDAIGAALTYNGSITQAGAQPSGFGVTRPFANLGMSGIHVTKTAGAYQVSASVDNQVQFQVRGATGPSGQVNVSSVTSPAITDTNYQDVASDLTPNMADLNGRPPRDDFWARDLTVIHERFHATERRQFAQQGVTVAQNQLNGQTASSAGEVAAKIWQVPNTVIATSNAAMTMPGKEQRAYGDGAPLYQGRAAAITNKGDAGGYP